jgi:hypothetical protein
MQEDIRIHHRSKIHSYHKLPMRKKMKNVVGQAEEPEIESEDTLRDHLLTVEDFRDTACTRNSRGQINSFWAGGDQETPSLQEKTLGTHVAQAIPEAQISPFWAEED